ncbi:uncharacterized protein LOC122317308 isoform X1 [Carya illinoinensis]|uniref:Phorbol-ester/DAG-type domain-containing protein n=3 Tax=Carya illinoinensis TaxID=32201 RepID=A0A8T1PXL8_CARIL|nr:uncharacterized protein LOC122317308 isoform X1 [Carya illinoinensis]KAG6646594.1 hypothetical protein CIPAW_07G018400 [Carya illinoinensis]
MELQHFSHPHPLLLNDDGLLEDDENYTHKCDFCWERLSFGTPCYTCKEGCKYFCIHKSCADLPHQLQHPSHPKHDPLTLSERKWDKENQQCNNCGRDLAWWWAYRYTCSRCEFYLCIKCVSLSLTTKVDIHDHPLTLMQKLSQFFCDHCEKEGNDMFYFCTTCSFTIHPKCTLLPLVIRPLTKKAEIHDHSLTLARKLNSFTCDACGKEGRSMFYFCVICSFVFHLDCASLPLVVKVIRHEHPLKCCQSYSLPSVSPSSHSVCQLCVNMVDTDYMVYHCSTCDFVAHLHCATGKEERDETFVSKYKDEESIESSTSMLEHEELGIDESTDILTYVVKKFKLGVDGIEIAAEIKNFSHEHDLKLTDEFGINEKCDACTQYIFTLYYACAQCRFFLHKSCVELRRRMRYPIHRHPLMLLPKATYGYDGTFGCDACDCSCDGFTYNCEECKFDLDVQCSLLPYKFTHDSHKHRLILSRSQEGRKCNNCDSNEKILFYCADCEFALDFQCLTLPHTVWYEQHEHLFTLCYAPEDDSDEYYCDICEEKRDPRFWFYYCADCLYLAHLKCILGEFPNEKYGN